MKLEQFDLQPEGVPVAGFDAGWQEPEYDSRTARTAWMSEGRRRGSGRSADVTLTVTESPLKQLTRAPAVTVSAGGRQLAKFSPATDFTQQIVLPNAALTASGGRVLLESDEWFSPQARGEDRMSAIWRSGFILCL